MRLASHLFDKFWDTQYVKKVKFNFLFKLHETYFLREAAKQVPPLMARPLRGGGVKAGLLRKKITTKKSSDGY